MAYKRQRTHSHREYRRGRSSVSLAHDPQRRRHRDEAIDYRLQGEPDLADKDYELEEAFYGVADDSRSPFIVKEGDNGMKSSSGTQGNLNARQLMHNADQQAWENNLLARGGVNKVVKGVDRDAILKEDQEEVKLIVRNSRPKFLSQDSGVVINLNGLKETVSVVKDPTSDMAKFAVQGSETIVKLREQKSRTKFRHRFWELGGSKIGTAIGVDKSNEATVEVEVEEEKTKDHTTGEDFRQRTGFSAHMKGRTKNKEQLKMLNKVELQEYKEYRQQMKQTRQSLPIYGVRAELLQIIRDNQVVVIIGETGSGKTTQLPQYVHEEGFCRNRRMVGCTQPRRVAAMSVAKRVSEEADCVLGEEVGYAIRFEDKTSRKTRIKYMTDGVLMRETLTDELLDKYAIVIMDEAHERSLHTDVLFAILKKVVIKRLDFKLIVTSATLDAEKFSNFFGGAAKFYIPGRTYEVETYFSRATCTDYVEAAVRKVIDIHLQNQEVQGDILVFMTGQEDINAVCEILAERVSMIAGQQGENFPFLLLLPMYSQLPSDLQAKIFLKAKPNQRKCIVSTNIAETSLTVDGIRFVVDSGFTKISVFNPRVGMDVLTLVPISQANANQRSGRAGRTSKGFCWRLYTELQYKLELLETHVPEIQRTNLGNVVLLLKSLGVESITDFEFMDEPPKDNLVNSMYQLWVLGALDNEGMLTPLGEQMARFPLDPLLSRMLIEAGRSRCEEEIVTIVSMLSVPDIFYRPPQRAEESDKAREKFFAPESDHLTLLNTYNQCRRRKFSSTFCSKHFIHQKAILKARDIRAQLCEEVLKNKRKQMQDDQQVGYRIQEIRLSTCNTQWDLVREALCSAYLLQVAKMKGLMKYVNLLTGIPGHLHPSSALCGMGQTPQYVVYHELVLTSKEYMRAVTAVEPKWLAKLGPMFYAVKQNERKRPKEAVSSSSSGSESSDSGSSTDDEDEEEEKGRRKGVRKNNQSRTRQPVKGRKPDSDSDSRALIMKQQNKRKNRQRRQQGM